MMNTIEQAQEKLAQWETKQAEFAARRAAVAAELGALTVDGESDLAEAVSERARLTAELASMDATAAGFKDVTRQLKRGVERARVGVARAAMPPVRARYAAEMDAAATALGDVEVRVANMAGIKLEGTQVAYGLADAEMPAILSMQVRTELKILSGQLRSMQRRLERTPWHADPFPCEVEEPEAPAPKVRPGDV
jgi:hypothetical protein